MADRANINQIIPALPEEKHGNYNSRNLFFNQPHSATPTLYLISYLYLNILTCQNNLSLF